MNTLLCSVVLALVLGGAARAAGQPPRPPAQPAPPQPAESARPAPAHSSGELDCRNCHLDKHQGVVRLYGGTGGRGTHPIPAKMFQVRVQCIACHTTPKTAAADAAIVGQTFKPTEQACVTCHGERYRGMLARWVTGLKTMRDSIAPKLAAARIAIAAADRTRSAPARAAKLIDDADFNARLVGFVNGVHNVFYAGSLLRLSNRWIDEALVLLGRPAGKTDDALVRGGYCGALCHEPAGMKLRETVSFQGRTLPHARHVAELGATCTSCHSADTHKALTAKPATCTSCHHSPQNDRCESCHQAPASFYRGKSTTPLATVTPNLMADAVSCTGCHDWSKKASREAIGQQCVSCHEASYLPLLTEWTAAFHRDVRATADTIKAAEATIARARQAGRKTAESDARLREARAALALVKSAGAAHNPLAADTLLKTARAKAQEATATAR